MKALPGDTRPLRHNTRWEKADTNKRRREIDIGTQNGAAAHRTYPQVDMKRTENQFTTDATTFASDLGLDQDEHYETNLEPGLDTHLLSIYPSIATSACYSVRSSLTPFRFGVSTGELTLSELYAQPYTFRKDIVEKGPYIDVYLGATRVYKRVSKALLYAFCRDIGRFLVCCNSRFIVQLPHGFSNVLSVKLAVGYMEESVLHPRFRSSPWKIPAYSSLCDYISLAELFTYIGCGDEANNLERAFVRRLREAPLSMEQVRNIWGRENLVHLSKYAEGMARNIVTWFCVPRLEVWMAQWDIFWDVKEGESTYKKEASGEHGDGGYAEGVEKKIRELAATYEVWKMDRKNALFKARHATNILDQFLEEVNNVALKQLVWTADPFEKLTTEDPEEFITIMTVQAPLPARQLSGMKRVEWRKKGTNNTFGDIAGGEILR